MSRLIAASIVVLASSVPARAQSYEVSWWTVDGGGTSGMTGGTYAISGTAGQPDAGGPFAGGAFFVTGGFWAVAGGGTGVPMADLSITKTDGVSVVHPGVSLTYVMIATNAGPSPATNATVSDAPPAALTNVSWWCNASAGSSCPLNGTGPINTSVSLLPGGSATFQLFASLSPLAGGTLTNTVTVATPPGVVDPVPGNNVASDSDTIVRVTEGELAHGTRLRGHLAAVGGVPDVDLFFIRQQPFASYEVVLDEASGDFGPEGAELGLVLSDGQTPLADSQPVGTGSARSLRFQNGTSTPIVSGLVRVSAPGCGTSCGPTDTYRLRVYETTASVPRFNNSGTQTTVLLLQNVTNQRVRGLVYAWGTDGALLSFQGIDLPPRGLQVLNTASLAPGGGGSLTLSHDGAYGALAGKAVALEAATGFSFDSPLRVRPR